VNQNNRNIFAKGGWPAHYVLLLLFFAYMLDYASRNIIYALFPMVKQEWGLSDTQLGSLSTAVSLTIGCIVFPISILVDRWSRRKTISLMIFLWSIATLACGYARNFSQMLLARALIGLGEAGYAPGGTAMISASYPEKQRSLALGVWNASIPLGIGLGMVAGGYFGKHYHWRSAFGWVAVPGILLSILVWFMRDYATVEFKQLKSSGQPLNGKKNYWGEILSLFGVPSLVFTYLGFAMNQAATNAILAWLPSYYTRLAGADIEQAGRTTALLALSVFLGAPLGGILADNWSRREPRARMLLPAVSSLLTGVIMLASFFIPAASWVRTAVNIGFGIMMVVYVAPSAAVTQDVVHPGLRAVSYAFNVVAMHLVVGGWSPMIIGYLSDKLGLAQAMMTIPVFCLSGSICFLLGGRYYLRDRERAVKVELVEEKG
jgi:MFS family permease